MASVVPVRRGSALAVLIVATRLWGCVTLTAPLLRHLHVRHGAILLRFTRRAGDICNITIA